MFCLKSNYIDRGEILFLAAAERKKQIDEIVLLFFSSLARIDFLPPPCLFHDKWTILVKNRVRRVSVSNNGDGWSTTTMTTTATTTTATTKTTTTTTTTATTTRAVESNDLEARGARVCEKLCRRVCSQLQRLDILCMTWLVPGAIL